VNESGQKRGIVKNPGVRERVWRNAGRGPLLERERKKDAKGPLDGAIAGKNRKIEKGTVRNRKFIEATEGECSKFENRPNFEPKRPMAVRERGGGVVGKGLRKRGSQSGTQRGPWGAASFLGV